MPESQDLRRLIKSHTPIIVIETREERRILELVDRVCQGLDLRLHGWSITEGHFRLTNDKINHGTHHEPIEILNHIWDTKNPGIYILLDFHHFLNDPAHIRLIKEIAHNKETYKQTLIFLSHKLDMPEELSHFTAKLEMKLPDEKELLKIVTRVAKRWSEENKNAKVRVNKKALNLLIKNLSGLAAIEVERVTQKAIHDGIINHDDLPEVAKEKYELLNKDSVLSFESNLAVFSQVGGLNNLKKWLEHRKAVFLAKNGSHGLIPPKGILLLGVQGSGKSLAAKAVAGSWQVPLLRLDFGAIYDKYYGETERRARDALKMAERMAPCVLWLDEIEKGISTDNTDGGTSRRVLGTLLTWMAERQSAVFIVATANDIQSLPPELLRKGRLDEIFFVDLPKGEVRKEIFAIHLKKRGLNPANFDLQTLASASKGFSGAEIEQAVVSGLYSIVGKSGKLTNQILLDVIQSTRPLSVVMAEQVESGRGML